MNYMTNHLMEAIVLNCRRLPKYARLTQGRSIKISLLLIWSESISLVSAFIMDTVAKYWQKKGVPVFVHEFISMEETPEFSSSYAFAFEPLKIFPRFEIPKKKLGELVEQKKYESLSSELGNLIRSLEKYPHIFCMTRHTLESFLRCSNLTPLHIQKAKELEVKSPEKFCQNALKSHLFAMGFCMFLDRLSFPIQNAGVPIVCQDVPPIPPIPNKY